MITKLYIHLIDGSEALIPVEAEHVENNQFKIKSFEDFDPEDTSVIRNPSAKYIFSIDLIHPILLS